MREVNSSNILWLYFLNSPPGLAGVLDGEEVFGMVFINK